MGFFSKVRKRIKKFIPKEVRPFAPYLAAGMIPGGGGLMGLAKKFGTAGLTKYLSDDEADLKDVARAGILAATPDAFSQYVVACRSHLGICVPILLYLSLIQGWKYRLNHIP